MRWSATIVFGCLLGFATFQAWDALEAAQTCSCAQTNPLGTCQIKAVNYSDLFPGSAAVVPIGSERRLYVADLYNGFTYLYNASTLGALTPSRFPSPLGSRLTTGLAYVTPEGEEPYLVYAIAGDLYRTNLEGQDALRLGTVQLAELAEFLRSEPGGESIETGELGGIAYHGTRGTLWAVDIVNDVYFEIELNGRLRQENGKPRYFWNPKRPRVSNGAYGNSIAYAATAQGEFFDIPVGSLADRRPSEVWRVHAADKPAEGIRIGDPTGIVYELGAALDSPPFVTGIAFWADSCGEGQHSEFLLVLPKEVASGGPPPRILQVTGDDPDAAGVVDFRCARDGESVKLTWRKTLPYDSLSITRRALGSGGTEETIFENADFAGDPQQFADAAIPEGSYEYAVKVTTGGRALPAARCRIAFGNGELVKAVRFAPRETPDPVPYAVTLVGSDKVAVADLETGNLQLYDLDLNPLETIPNPRPLGYMVGLAYVSIAEEEGERQLLYWLSATGNGHYLSPTDLEGEPVDVPAFVLPPENLFGAGVALGEIDYDPLRELFWTVDFNSQSVYAFLADGTVAEAFVSQQPPAPAKGGFLSGGIAISSAGEGRIAFDIPAGEKAAGFADQIRRVEYDPSDPAAEPAQIFSIDVPAAIGSAAIGSLDLLETEEGLFAYVTAMDTGTVYKLRVSKASTSQTLYRRGDANNDGTINISDPSFILEYLFRKGAEPPCMIAADADDSDAINITDAVYLFRYLFKGGQTPPRPFPGCGLDPDAKLPCAQSFCSP